MVSMSIELTDEEAAQLRARASSLSVAPEQLAATVLARFVDDGARSIPMRPLSRLRGRVKSTVRLTLDEIDDAVAEGAARGSG